MNGDGLEMLNIMQTSVTGAILREIARMNHGALERIARDMEEQAQMNERKEFSEAILQYAQEIRRTTTQNFTLIDGGLDDAPETD